jgi:hypothetical protein
VAPNTHIPPHVRHPLPHPLAEAGARWGVCDAVGDPYPARVDTPPRDEVAGLLTGVLLAIARGARRAPRDG